MLPKKISGSIFIIAKQIPLSVQKLLYHLGGKGYSLHMIYLDLIQGIGRNMLRSLLQITDSCGIFKFLNYCVQRLIRYDMRFRTLGSANREKMIFFSSGV